jgi:hypothetical protein
MENWEWYTSVDLEGQMASPTDYLYGSISTKFIGLECVGV